MFSDVKYQNVSIFFSKTLKKLGGLGTAVTSTTVVKWDESSLRTSWIRLAMNVTIPHI